MNLMVGCNVGKTVNLAIAEICLTFYHYFLAFLVYALNTKVVINFAIWALTKFQHYLAIV